MNEKITKIKNEVKKAVKGKDDIIEKVLAAILAGGHVLLEDIPGVGKTTLALSLSGAMSLDYKRIQFTPDVLPSDIVGFSMYDKQTGTFEYRPGAILCHLFLADEINRTSPKTQSALLEVMEEGRVTVDGVTREVPKPFIVIATQNPFGSSGTQRLPESQLDRFMVRLTMGYPDRSSSLDILKINGEDSVRKMSPVLGPEELHDMQASANQMYVDETIYSYIVDLTEMTREMEQCRQGASPRGSISLLRMSKAMAFIRGRDFVTPEDVHAVFFDVLSHRISLSPKARASDVTERDVLDQVLNRVRAPHT